ncbi:MAG TPA: LysR family transcriptional regulator [Nocardioidaceae bacterium]|nr:LysR family transcriptional regulator [Nocardioidaceae bacterium]
MEIELRHLRLVKAIAEEGSITRAAAALGSTQPAVTRLLRRLENTLGGPLFVRSRDGVEPTSLGKLVIARAQAVLPVIDSLRSDVEASKLAGPVPEKIRVGAENGPVMVGLLRGIRNLFTGTEVVTESQNGLAGLLELVTGGHVHLAGIHEFIGHEIVLGRDLAIQTVGCEPIFVMLAEDHPLASREELALADLAEQSWVLTPLDIDREYDMFAAACGRAGFSPRVDHYLTGVHNLEVVRSGEALGLTYAVSRFRGVASRPLVGSPVRIRHMLIADQHSPLVPHLEKLARYVLDNYTETAAEQPTYTAWLGKYDKLALEPAPRRSA